LLSTLSSPLGKIKTAGNTPQTLQYSNPLLLSPMASCL